mmetsp:Transcript_17063/g.43614  ORF Transcript_17063/g.43614 Transcript_17063/m.43614 type:complete len:286 (+) Transcript_17063:683-1540(+)
MRSKRRAMSSSTVRRTLSTNASAKSTRGLARVSSRRLDSNTNTRNNSSRLVLVRRHRRHWRSRSMEPTRRRLRLVTPCPTWRRHSRRSIPRMRQRKLQRKRARKTPSRRSATSRSSTRNTVVRRTRQPGRLRTRRRAAMCQKTRSCPHLLCRLVARGMLAHRRHLPCRLHRTMSKLPPKSLTSSTHLNPRRMMQTKRLQRCSLLPEFPFRWRLRHLRMRLPPTWKNPNRRFARRIRRRRRVRRRSLRLSSSRWEMGQLHSAAVVCSCRQNNTFCRQKKQCMLRVK